MHYITIADGKDILPYKAILFYDQISLTKADYRWCFVAEMRSIAVPIVQLPSQQDRVLASRRAASLRILDKLRPIAIAKILNNNFNDI